jgi:hypothetical protein
MPIQFSVFTRAPSHLSVGRSGMPLSPGGGAWQRGTSFYGPHTEGNHADRAASPAPAVAAGSPPTRYPSSPMDTDAAAGASQPRCRTRARGNHTREQPSWTAQPPDTEDCSTGAS